MDLTDEELRLIAAMCEELLDNSKNARFREMLESIAQKVLNEQVVRGFTTH